MLEQTLQRVEFLHNCEEEESWLREHMRMVEDLTLGGDLGQIAAALQKHKVPAPLCPAHPHLPAAPTLPSASSLLCAPPGLGGRAPQPPGCVH